MIVTLSGKNAQAVSSIDEAVSVCEGFRDGYDSGFGMGSTKYYNLRVGRVFAGTKQIARVHYNGRVEMA